MERLTVDEAIIHAREVAKNNRRDSLYKTASMNPEINARYKSDCIKCAEEHEQLAEWLEELKVYRDLEEQGLLLRLPCKVGDTIYRINQYAKEPIISMKVLQVRFVEFCIGNTFLRIDAINDEDMGEFCYFKENIGKTVFLTREEAEQALKEGAV